MSSTARQERLSTVLLGPHVSEKSAQVNERGNQVVFRVRRDATKAEVKRAVELLLDVQVVGVTVLNQRGKNKRFGARLGRRSDWKKAYVRLAEGQDLEMLGAGE